MLRKLTITLFSLFFIFSYQAQASHIVASDLTVSCTGGNDYEVVYTFYRDCSGISAPTSVFGTLSSSCATSTSITLVLDSTSGNEIITNCTSSPTVCNGGVLPGIEKYVYRTTINALAPCSDWTFSYSTCCRNSAITNLVNASSYGTYSEVGIDNLGLFCNSSPTFTNDPVMLACVGQNTTFNHGAIDPDGDSLVFSLDTPRAGISSNVVFASGYSATSPLSSSTAFTINAQTGDINFTPSIIEVGVLAVRVDEYRNGNLIGTVVRDIQIWVNNCSNTVPTASGIDGSGIYSLSACPGQNICFTINSSDADSFDILSLTWNAGISGATFTTDSASQPTGTFCWNVPTNYTGSNPAIFTVTVSDDACPQIGTQTFSYAISIGSAEFDVNVEQGGCSGSGSVAYISTTIPSYTVLWSNGETGDTVDGLQPGTYFVTVFDSLGCTGTDTFEVVGGIGITLTDSVVNNGCDTNCSGIINVYATGGTQPYVYQWSNGATTSSLTGLCAGVYDVTVAGQNGCMATASYTITSTTPPVITSTVTAETCPGACDGTITNSVSGGVPPYTYLWTDGSTSQNRTGLCPGLYPVTVTDANGCTAYDCRIISTGGSIYTYGTTSSASCGDCNGGINVYVYGNSGPYTFQWSNGATTQNLSAVCPGSYSVTVSDASGCSTVDSFSVGNTGALYVSKAEYDESCDSSCDGSIDIDVIGGTAPYYYQWSNGATTQDVSGLCAGTYDVTVIDATGCSVTLCGVIGTRGITLTTTRDDVDCNGACTGSASVMALGGVEPYSYSWSNGMSTSSITGLCAGSYDVTVTDATGCTALATVPINEPAPISLIVNVANSTTTTSCDGSINLGVTGGTMPYTYAWTNGATTQNISGLCPIAYHVIVTDANGCWTTICGDVGVGQDTVCCGNTGGGNSGGGGIPVFDGNVQASPIPSMGGIILSFGPELTKTNVSLRLASQNGTIVKREEHSSIDGGKLRWDLSNLASGTYYLLIDSKFGKEIEEIIISK